MSIQESAPEAPAVEASEPVVTDAPVEAAPDAPVVEAPTEEAPSGETPEVPAGETPAPVVDPYEEFGGREEIERAHRLYQASQNEDGVIQLFLEAGQNLGLGLKEIQSLFGEPAEPAEEVDLDEPMTRGEFLAAQKSAAEAAAARQIAAAQESARQTIQATVKDLGLDPEDPATQVILNLGDKHFDENDLSPAAVAAAVRQGHADYQALVEREHKAYLAKKAGVAETVPGAPSGAGAATETPQPEPQSVAEAIKRVREKMRQG